MPEIVVNINDQDYAIVCDPGEENHLKQLSSRIDFKVRELTCLLYTSDAADE